LCLALLFFVSCEQAKDYGRQALEWVGLSGSESDDRETSDPGKRPADGKPVPKRALDRINGKKRDAKAKTAPASKGAGGETSDIIITKTEEQKTRKVEKKDLKSAQKPEFRVEAPVDVQKRVGGAARLIRADDEFIYMDFPQYFAVYDKNLNALTHVPIAFPLKKVQRFPIDGKTYLYLSEENDVLEVVELVKTVSEQGESYALNDVVSYEVGGRFTWIDAKTLLILLPKKLQFLDFSNFNEVKIVNEIPTVDVADAYSVENGKSLYLSRKGFLDILDGASSKLISSLRIGRDFTFLGESTADGKRDLVLSLSKDDSRLESIQFLRLTDDGSGVMDFGQALTLDKPLRRYSVDFVAGLAIGEEEVKDGTGPVRIFSFAEKRFLRGTLSTQTNLMAWSAGSDKIYLATPLEISINSVSIHAGPAPEPISPAPRPAPVPLAQIGAVKTVRDEYELTPEKSIEFMADARKVVMLDENHFVVLEYRARQGIHQLFASTDFASEGFGLVEPRVAEPTTYDKLLPTDFGLLAYSQAKKTAYFMDVGMKSLDPLPIKPGEILSWTNFSSTEGEILLVTAKLEKSPKGAPAKPAPAARKPAVKPVETPKTPAFAGAEALEKKAPAIPELTSGAYAVLIYLLKSPQEMELLSQIYFNEKPFVLRSMENEILTLTGSGITFYSIEDLRKPARNDLDKVVFDKPVDFVAVKPFLVNNRVYSLIREDDRYKVLAFSLTDPVKERVTLGDIDVTPDQFEGSSFSKGGQLYILPTGEGTLFYDMTDLKPVEEDKRIAAHWVLPAEYVDVARSGKFVCVALGAKGVYCGNILFY
jgi:hypothetical protein